MSFKHDFLQIVDKKSKMWEGTIEKILDIEENIWSPKYGISGRIDVTVQVKIYNRKTNKSKIALKFIQQIFLYLIFLYFFHNIRQ